MHRIDTTTAKKDKFGAGKNGFTRGNPQTGVPATDLDDDYFDAIQEELAGVVEGGGLTLNKADRGQILKALKLLFAANTDSMGALAALVGDANKLPYFTGPEGAALTDLTAFARQILANTDAASARSTIGLTALGIGGLPTRVPALDWQTFNFVPGANYTTQLSTMTNIPPDIDFSGNQNLINFCVIGNEGVGSTGIDVLVWRSTVTTAYRFYHVRITGNLGGRTFKSHQFLMASDPTSATFTSSGVFTVPSSITEIYVSACAAGGGGAPGAGGSNSYYGGGG